MLGLLISQHAESDYNRFGFDAFYRISNRLESVLRPISVLIKVPTANISI